MGWARKEAAQAVCARTMACLSFDNGCQFGATGHPAQQGFGLKFAAGTLSGALAAGITSPTELVKTRYGGVSMGCTLGRCSMRVHKSHWDHAPFAGCRPRVTRTHQPWASYATWSRLMELLDCGVEPRLAWCVTLQAAR